MKLAFLGNTCEVSSTEIPTIATGKTGLYQGHTVHFRSAQVLTMPSKSLTYRGNAYLA